MNWKSASWIAFVVLVLSIAGLAWQHSLLATHPVLLAVQVLAFALMVWARITFGARSFHAGANPTAGGLITTGPYRFVRHPIYAAILYFVAASLISRPSLINAGFAAVAVLGVAVRIMAEERLLLGMYPEYSEYAARVKRVVPWLI